MDDRVRRVSFLRHSGMVTPGSFKHVVHIIGCGAVGSHVALAAAKMGWTDFDLWDMDVVEDHNLPNQIYGHEHIGLPKVDALADMLLRFNPAIKVSKHQEYFGTPEHEALLRGPLVIATDSMKSRSEITKLFSYNTNIAQVLEARLGFDYGEVHIIDPLNAKQLEAWKSSLKDDSEIPEGPCNLKICPTLVGVVAFTLVHYLCTPYAERRSGQREWDPPFLTRFLLKDTLQTRIVNI